MIKKIKAFILNKKNRIFLFLIGILLLLVLLKLFQKEAVTPTVLPKISPTPSEPIYPSTTPTTIPLEGKGEPNFDKKVAEDLNKYYPLFNYLPHKTDNYLIGYSDSLTLIVVLKQDTPEIRQEVLDWISSKGVDPNTHKIIWKTP